VEFATQNMSFVELGAGKALFYSSVGGVIEFLAAERKFKTRVTTVCISLFVATCFDFGDKGNYKIHKEK
jgi:hypothetical protein